MWTKIFKASVALLLALAGIAVWYLLFGELGAPPQVARNGRSSTSTTATPKRPTAPGARGAILDNTKQTAAPLPQEPSFRNKSLGSLPTLERPLALAIPDLKERAQNGDAQAALELWHGLHQCAGLTNGLAEELLDLRKHRADNDPTAIPPDYSGAIGELLNNCKDVTHEQMSASLHWLKLSASLGSPDAQYIYSRLGVGAFPGDSGSQRIRYALSHPEEWLEYRDTAISYMDGLVKSCNQHALATQADTLMRGDQIFPMDKVKGYAYWLVAERIKPSDPRYADLITSTTHLTPEQMAVAQHTQAQFFDQYCN